MSSTPESRYARTDDGLSIAYQTLGDGPRDIVLTPTTHAVDVMWDDPSFGSFLRRLARLGRLTCIDYRGFGGSDPVPLGALPSPETWMEDTRVVLDRIGATNAHLICHGGSGFAGILFAATYPERTATLSLIQASARTRRAPDYDAGVPDDVVDRFIEWSGEVWGTERTTDLWAPSRIQDAPFRRWFARFQRGSASPATNVALLRWVTSLDLREVLPTIRVPTLILHKSDCPITPLDQGRYLADHILGARWEVIEGSDYLFFTERASEILDHIEEFITGEPVVDEPDRSLATVLFTDIVSSTQLAAGLGDRAWKQTLDQHDSIVERELARHRGRKVNTTGDGIVATFDGPARGVRCARAISEHLRSLGLEIRAGLHTGEIQLRGHDIGGIAVHLAQRVSALAAPGEILVSRTVKDLVTGSDLEFDDRGSHNLKGVPGIWELYAAR